MSKFYCLLLTLFILGCNESKPKDDGGVKTPLNSETTSASKAQSTEDLYGTPVQKYPGLALEEMEALVKNTTLIDYIFYDLPISMNMDNQGGINQALNQIAPDPAKIFPGCKAMGRIIFQNNGEIIKEADFYFARPCFYFVFIEDGKPAKANLMTQDGIKFFANLLANASGKKLRE